MGIKWTGEYICRLSKPFLLKTGICINIKSKPRHCLFRFGTKLGTDPVLEDMMWASLTDKLPNLPMGVTAENLAERYSLTREEVDAFALRSQTSWGKANEAGVFKVRSLSAPLRNPSQPTLRSKFRNLGKWPDI